jgi:dihydrofolate reductase
MQKLLLLTIIVILAGVQQTMAQVNSGVDCSVVGKPVVYLSHIVAMAENNVIGNDHNQMPWGHALKEDLKRFRTLTADHVVIMGRKTFDSMYASMGGKILPKRHSIVITRDPSKVLKDPNVTAVTSIEEAVKEAQKLTDKYPNEVFIIGGGEIFSTTQHLVKKIYLTVIKQNIDGAVSYPKINADDFNVVSETDRTEAGYTYTFRDLERK